MNTIEFLEKELKSYEEDFHNLGLNYWTIINDLVEKTGRSKDAATIEVEAIKREVRERRDFLRELIKKAKEKL